MQSVNMEVTYKPFKNGSSLVLTIPSHLIHSIPMLKDIAKNYDKKDKNSRKLLLTKEGNKLILSMYKTDNTVAKKAKSLGKNKAVVFIRLLSKGGKKMFNYFGFTIPKKFHRFVSGKEFRVYIMEQTGDDFKIVYEPVNP